MSRLCACLTAALFILFVYSTVPAQETDPGPALKDPAIERKAMEWLESIAERIPNLNSSGNRILLTMSVADLLWSRDEKRARLLYEDITREMSAIAASVDFSDPDVHQNLGWIQQQRQQILDRLAQRDPELALTFLRATRLPSLNMAGTFRASLNSIRSPDNETNLEIHLASQLALKNPEMALSLARASLSKGVSHNLISLLSQLHQKDPATARKFHREVIDRINNEEFNPNLQAVNVAFSLLSGFQPPQADEQTYRDFIEQLASKVLGVKSGATRGYQFDHNLYNLLRSAMPLVEKYSPSRVQALRQWSQGVERMFDPSWRTHNELNEIYQKATAQEILAIASKYPEEIQPQIYQQAIWKAMNSGDTEVARQMATELLSGQAQQQMLAQIDNRALWKAANENNVAETRRLALRAKDAERVQTLTNLASRLLNNGDREVAAALLEEVKGVLATMPQGSRKLAAQLQLAQSYSLLDLDQGAAIMQSVIVQLNELVAAAAVLDGFENRYLRDGEWMMFGHSNLSNVVNTLDQNLGQIAIHDHDRAWRLSEQIERTEIRLKTQVAIVGKVLETAIRDLPLQKTRIVNLN